MKADKALGPIEEKIYQSFNEDGAMNTASGVMSVLIGLCIVVWPTLLGLLDGFPMIDDIGLLLPAAVIMLPGLLLIRQWRRRITYPRLGYSKFIAKRDIPNSRKWRTILLWFVLVLAFRLSLDYAMKLNSAVYPLPAYQDDINMIISIIGGMWLGTMGFIIGLKRMWMIVFSMLAMIWLAAYIHVSQGWVIVVLGLLLTQIGLKQLRHFLEKYPQPESASVQ